MPKIRRGGCVFLSWKSDQDPRHMHVYRDGRLVVKWDLDRGIVMKGSENRRVRALIAELRARGLL